MVPLKQSFITPNKRLGAMFKVMISKKAQCNANQSLFIRKESQDAK